MATAPATTRTPFGRPLEFWNNTSTANRIVLAGVAAVLLVALAGLFAVTQREDLSKVALGDGYEFGAEERAAAIRAFTDANLRDYEVSGQLILVPKNSLNLYQGALATADALGGNFDKPIKDYTNNQRTWWASQSDAERLLLLAKERKTALMISAIDGVREATVIVAPADRLSLRRVGKAKASVLLSVYKPLGAAKIDQIRQMVAYAFPELDSNRVSVTVNGPTGAGQSDSIGVDIEAAMANNKYLQTKEAYAEVYEKRIRRLLGDLDGVVVVANVDLEREDDVNQNVLSFGKGVIQAQDTTSRTSETASGIGSPGGEPGVVPNTVPPGTPVVNQAVSAGPAQPNTESDETNLTRFNNNRIETTQRISGLTPKKVGIVVNVPRQYLESSTGPDGQPRPPARTEADISDSIVRLGIPGLTAENVKVVRYTPVEPPAPPTVTFAPAEIAREYGSVILYGLLGIAAVIAALIIARRSTIPTLVTPQESPEDSAPLTDDELLPKLPESEAAQRFEKIQETVTSMVGKEPEVAASLIRRWITEEE